MIFGDGSQAYDFVHVADVARANILALKSDATDEFFNVGMGVRDDDRRARRRCCSSSPAPTSSPSTGRRSRSFVTERVGSTEKAERAARLPRERAARGGPRVGRSSGGARDQRVAGRLREQIPIARPLFGPEELARGPAAARERLGASRGRSSRSSSSASPRTPARRTRSRRRRARRALHLDRRGARRQAGRRGDRPGVHVGLDGERRRVHGRDAGLLRRRPRRRSTSTSTQLEPLVTERTVGDHPRAPVRPLRGHRRRSSSSRGGAGSGSSRTPPARSAPGTTAATSARFGDAGAFSFHPRKSITTGEGGMVTTTRRRARGARRARCAITARTRPTARRRRATDAFLLADFPHLGFNYRMTDIQGALGCAQMDRARRDPRRAGASSPRATTSCSPASTGSRRRTCRTATSTATRRTSASSAPRSRRSTNVERLHRARNDADARARARRDRRRARARTRRSSPAFYARQVRPPARSSSRTRTRPIACRSRCRSTRR